MSKNNWIEFTDEIKLSDLFSEDNPIYYNPISISDLIGNRNFHDFKPSNVSKEVTVLIHNCKQDSGTKYKMEDIIQQIQSLWPNINIIAASKKQMGAKHKVTLILAIEICYSVINWIPNIGMEVFDNT